MAVIHREDSIKEINKDKEEKQKGLMAIGQQMARLTFELAEKDKTIETLGKQAAVNTIETAKLKQEIELLKGGN